MARDTMELHVRHAWDMGRAEVRALTAQTARNELAGAQREGDFPANSRAYVTRVDNRTGRHGQEHRVRYGGKIAYLRWGGGTDWIEGAVEIIRLVDVRASKVHGTKRPGDRSGAAFRRRHYKDGFMLLRNNAAVVSIGPGFAARAIRWLRTYATDATPDDVFSITNIQPYARRIDKGAPGNTPWASAAPRGVLNAAYRAARVRRKTRALFLNYETRPLPGGISNSERESQGATSTYADRRRTRGRWRYSGRIIRKHRVYPVLSFWPPFQGQGRFATNRPDTPWTHRQSYSEVAGYSGGLPGDASARTGMRVNIRVG